MLGLDSAASAAEISARIESEWERFDRLKKIPKRRAEAEGGLIRLGESKRVLLIPPEEPVRPLEDS